MNLSVSNTTVESNNVFGLVGTVPDAFSWENGDETQLNNLVREYALNPNTEPETKAEEL